MKKKHILAIVLTALAALVVLYALFWRETAGQTTVVSLPSPEPAESAPVESAPAEEFASVTADTVQAALSSLSRPASYSRAVTISYFWAGGHSSSELYSWVDGERTKIRIPMVRLRPRRDLFRPLGRQPGGGQVAALPQLRGAARAAIHGDFRRLL